MDDITLVLDTIEAEIQYLNRAGCRLAMRHPSVLKAAVAWAYRQTLAEHEGSMAVVEGYYKTTGTRMLTRNLVEPRVDVFASWEGEERYVELRWGWGRRQRKAWVEHYLVPSLRDLGKLIDFTPRERSGHRVFVFVATAEEPRAEVERALRDVRTFLPPRAPLERQLVSLFQETTGADLPGGFSVHQWRDLWHACGYLAAVVRRLAENEEAVQLRVLEDKASVSPERTRRYVALCGRF